MTDTLTQARACFLDGLAAFEGDRLAEAARHFEAALELAPGRPSVMLNLGITRMRLGHPQLALSLLEQVTALSAQRDVAVSTPRFGERLDIGSPDHGQAWWQRDSTELAVTWSPASASM